MQAIFTRFVRALPASRRHLVRLLDGVGMSGKLPHYRTSAVDYAAEIEALRTFPLRLM